MSVAVKSPYDDVELAYLRKALQHPGELLAFIDLVRKQGARSYLEIGSKFGGSLWHVAGALLPNSRIVAVDLPKGTVAWPGSGKSLEACIRHLRKMGHDARVVWGDSTSDEVVSRVRELGPFDVIMLDGNHTAAYVRKDWENYGPLGKMVAFHDIAWQRPADWKGGYRIDVPAFWSSIKSAFTSAEIKMDPTGQDNGFGVLWRA